MCASDSIPKARVTKYIVPQFGYQQTEFSENHVHIFDIIAHNAPGDDKDSAWEWDVLHPDFIFAWELAKQFARSWHAILSQQFPGHQFVVFASKLNDPIIRFYRIRETDIFTAEDLRSRIDADEIFILVTGRPPTVAEALAHFQS